MVSSENGFTKRWICFIHLWSVPRGITCWEQRQHWSEAALHHGSKTSVTGSENKKHQQSDPKRLEVNGSLLISFSVFGENPQGKYSFLKLVLQLVGPGGGIFHAYTTVWQMLPKRSYYKPQTIPGKEGKKTPEVSGLQGWSALSDKSSIMPVNRECDSAHRSGHQTHFEPMWHIIFRVLLNASIA